MILCLSMNVTFGFCRHKTSCPLCIRMFRLAIHDYADHDDDDDDDDDDYDTTAATFNKCQQMQANANKYKQMQANASKHKQLQANAIRYKQNTSIRKYIFIECN